MNIKDEIDTLAQMVDEVSGKLVAIAISHPWMMGYVDAFAGITVRLNLLKEYLEEKEGCHE